MGDFIAKSQLEPAPGELQDVSLANHNRPEERLANGLRVGAGQVELIPQLSSARLVVSQRQSDLALARLSLHGLL